LPGESKVEKRKTRARGEGVVRNLYCGEQFQESGKVGNRVVRNVGKGRDNGKGLLERREKKRRDDEEGRGGGVGIG
jgi:hypothetical protein